MGGQEIEDSESRTRSSTMSLVFFESVLDCLALDRSRGSCSDFHKLSNA